VYGGATLPSSLSSSAGEWPPAIGSEDANPGDPEGGGEANAACWPWPGTGPWACPAAGPGAFSQPGCAGGWTNGRSGPDGAKFAPDASCGDAPGAMPGWLGMLNGDGCGDAGLGGGVVVGAAAVARARLRPMIPATTAVGTGKPRGRAGMPPSRHHARSTSYMAASSDSAPGPDPAADRSGSGSRMSCGHSRRRGCPFCCETACTV
jgi:hypothetical protein